MIRIASTLGVLCAAALAATLGWSREPAGRTIAFETDEGTFLCVDVSPDGRTLAFDMLGDLYTLPMEGGRATPLLSGRAWDRCPRFSPDGTRVAFLSDRAGLENLWVLDIARGDVRQLTDLPLTSWSSIGVTGTPVWLPGEDEIAFRIGRLGEARIGIVPAAGGDTRMLAPDRRGASSPAFAQDGTTAFIAAFEPDAENAGWQKNTGNVLYRLHRATGAMSRLTDPVAGREEFKPVLSRSGRLLAYGRSNGPNDHELRLRDLASGDDRTLLTLTDADDVVAGASYVGDEIPGYAFTQNDASIVIWNGGKLHRVDVADGSSTVIPFTVAVTRDVAPLVRAHHRISDAPLAVRSIRWPSLAPDGHTLVFSAVGSLWTMSLPDGAPQRVTGSDDLELMPAFSPDGTQLAYIAFTHTAGATQPPGRLTIRNVRTGETRVAIADAANYWVPSWSPDGTKLAVVREAGTGRAAPTHYGWVDLVNGQFHEVAPAPQLAAGEQRYIAPQHVVFSRDGDELLYVHGPDADWNIALRGTSIDGRATRELMTAGADVVGFFPSPDLSRTVLIGWDYEAYVAALPPRGEAAIRVSIQDPATKAALTRVSEGGALYPRWLDARTLLYGWTTSIFTHRLGGPRGALAGRVALTVPRRGGRGAVAFRDARLITMNGARGAGDVVERGTIVVRDRRIVAIGPGGSTPIPADAAVIDASGMTIMPGIIDTHTHGLEGISLPAIPIGAPDRSVQSGLAYGVTTAWEATGRTSDDAGLSRVELLESGRVRGGRWFPAVGRFTLLEPHGVPYANAAEVRNVVRRKIELGGEPCLKNYFGKFRDMAQWMADAARENGICVVAHVGYPSQLLSRVVDGYSVDHPALWAPAYRDVIEFLARSGAIWTVHENFPRSSARPGYARWMYEELRARGDARELRMFERYIGSGRDRLVSAPLVPWAETSNARIARVAAAIMAAGGKIAASTDGLPLIENHFQFWSFQRAGMSTGDVLRTATMIPAEKLGVHHDLGSLEAGKIADLLVLSKNPLERIEHTLSLRYTVLGGVIYDSETLEVLTPRDIR